MGKEPRSNFDKIQHDAQAVIEESPQMVMLEHELTRFQRFVHFWALVIRSFTRNRCPIRASALAYASLLALVPMLAVVASVSASFLKSQGEDRIEQFVEKMVDAITPESKHAKGEVAPDSMALQQRKEIAKRINEFIQNIRSGALGTTGTILLVFMAITMLARIEDTFNDIWGITQGRNWVARIIHYWAALTLGPMLLIVALALTSGPYFELFKETLEALPLGVGKLVNFSFRFLPLFITSLTFTLFYQLIPNTKVQWRAAVVGGVMSGVLWQLNSVFSVLYVSRVVTNSKIYGSLGMIPVVMIGLYFSWLILLFGAQVAYAYQNRRSYLQEKQVESISQTAREFIALRLMVFIAQRFSAGEKPPSSQVIADTIGAPTRLVAQLLGALMQAQLVLEANGGESRYSLSRPAETITCQDILEAMRRSRSPELAMKTDAVRQLVSDRYDEIKLAEREVAGAMNLATLVAELGPSPTPAVMSKAGVPDAGRLTV